MTPNGNESNDARSDHMEIRLGRRKSDVTIIFEWAMKRGLIKCNIAYVQGIFLEEIPSRLIPKETVRNPNNMKPVVVYDKIQMAMVLVCREWGNFLYFMNERPDWSEDDYFEAAALLIQNQREADDKFKQQDDE